MRLKAAGYARDATVPLCAARIAGTTASKGSKTRYTYRITPVPYIRTHLFPDPAHARRYTPDGRAQRLHAVTKCLNPTPNVTKCHRAVIVLWVLLDDTKWYAC